MSAANREWHNTNGLHALLGGPARDLIFQALAGERDFSSPPPPTARRPAMSESTEGERAKCQRVVVFPSGDDGPCGYPLPCWRHPEQKATARAPLRVRIDLAWEGFCEEGGLILVLLIFATMLGVPVCLAVTR